MKTVILSAAQRSRKSDVFRYAANYSLVAPVSFGLILYIVMSAQEPTVARATSETIIGGFLVLTLTAIPAGIFSLFGLRAGTKTAILVKVIPGLLIASLIAFVMYGILTFVG